MKNISEQMALRVPDGGRTFSSIALIWEKPERLENVTGYAVYINGKYECDVRSTCFAAEGLEPELEYSFSVAARMGDKISEICAEIKASTLKKGKIIDVSKPPYNADGNGHINCTDALQAAIDDCSDNGIVLIPEGEYLSGALFLHSGITLEINGTLKGSAEPADYPMIDSRFEGWELKSHSSLINAGSISHGVTGIENNYSCENIVICGRGAVIGGGSMLAARCMDEAVAGGAEPEQALRCRGRLINLSCCKNVNISGLTLKDPPCWTLHMVYCSGITTHGVRFESTGVHNGDGWDPDSSEHCTIFDCEFRTGDDCIAIKSGKNPEGNVINRPSKDIRIYDCRFFGGLGLAIGSEMSGGIDGVYIRGCEMRNTRYGLELKATDRRGGYIRNVRAENCSFDRILAHKVEYNDDGEAAPDKPVFSDMTFSEISVCGNRTYKKTEPMRYAIELEGFDCEHMIENIGFINISLGDETDVKRAVSLKYCKDISFKKVLLKDGSKPEYDIDETCGNIKVR